MPERYIHVLDGDAGLVVDTASKIVVCMCSNPNNAQIIAASLNFTSMTQEAIDAG